MRREAAREALGFLLQTAAMFSLHIISAVVLVYCTIATAGPTSDEWFMKEMANLMEAKEQMDALLDEPHQAMEVNGDIEMTEMEQEIVEENDGKRKQTTDKMIEGEETTDTRVEQQLEWLMSTSEAQIQQQTCNPTTNCKGVVELVSSISSIQKQLLELTISLPRNSCKDLDPKIFPSRNYSLLGNDGKLHEVYCEMGEFGNNQSGGWMRLAKFGPGDPCPKGLEEKENYCKRDEEQKQGGCFSVVFPTNGISYSRVYGKIIGIQKGSTDAFEPTYKYIENSSKRNNSNERVDIGIDETYLDGISLTYGSPDNRFHIWSFASQFSADTAETPLARRCFCNSHNTNLSKIPRFVGQNYFCDTGVLEGKPNDFDTYYEHPLWDECKHDACCTTNNSTPPWFYRRINETCSDIEMRVCTSQDRDDEDIFIKEMELYIQ